MEEKLQSNFRKTRLCLLFRLSDTKCDKSVSRHQKKSNIPLTPSLGYLIFYFYKQEKHPRRGVQFSEYVSVLNEGFITYRLDDFYIVIIQQWTVGMIIFNRLGINPFLICHSFFLHDFYSSSGNYCFIVI